ncbi:hypothetical protein CAOG_009911 [Capsaspora owczarzaki ATCC 30864]|uniref:Uncharacterized protein n=1 Tax=Capsaspora owczarzaki (strain ATCC 30864) TaxID=595528 RepID=A0A0D2WU24_CAPO3|nr:hypothetical protein CAOG_009911 [Capsaspora owczarzaki ATCC 30864]
MPGSGVAVCEATLVSVGRTSCEGFGLLEGFSECFCHASWGEARTSAEKSRFGPSKYFHASCREARTSKYLQISGEETRPELPGSLEVLDQREALGPSSEVDGAGGLSCSGSPEALGFLAAPGSPAALGFSEVVGPSEVEDAEAGLGSEAPGCPPAEAEAVGLPAEVLEVLGFPAEARCSPRSPGSPPEVGAGCAEAGLGFSKSDSCTFLCVLGAFSKFQNFKISKFQNFQNTND